MDDAFDMHPSDGGRLPHNDGPRMRGPIAGGGFTALFDRLHGDRLPYYSRWIHEAPMVISPRRNCELEMMQRILYRCACRYAQHYRDYLHIIPYSEATLETLEYCERYPFKAGAYRPDFLICEDGALRICEITSRFFGNGYFLSYYYEEAARRRCGEAGIDDRISYMEDMLAYFAQMTGGKDRLVVLKSSDNSDSIRLYVPFYEALGLKATILESNQIEANSSVIEDAFVVSALNQMDLAKLSVQTRHLMADVGCRNDFRTIYLLHDKRFFRLFSEDSFTSNFLTDEETAFLRAHTVETYLPNIDWDMFEEARHDKDSFIMKHRCLGKSEKVYAGCLCSARQWDALFKPGIVENMILQPFQRQRTYSAVWEGQTVRDYACATILSIDDRYFGPGLLRTSSCPVINQTDDRKFCHAVTAQGDRFAARYEL